MIKGVGTDIIDISRMQAIIDSHGSRFLKRVFTGPEIAMGEGRVNKALFFAGRWAAKEAFFKALPRSCQSVSSWKSIQVLALEGSGRPVVEICGSRLKRNLKTERIENVYLSISHERSLCVAFVVME